MKNSLYRYTALILAVIFTVLMLTSCKTRAYEDVPKPVSIAEAVAQAEAEAEAERLAAEEAEKAAREAEEEAKKVQKTEGTAAVGNVDILYGRMNRGSEVNVISDADTPASFYTILLEDGDKAIIDRSLVRLESEKPFAEYTAAAKEQIEIYNSAYFDRAVTAVIEPEAEFSVIDEFGGVRAVKYGDKEGYISASAGIERKSGEAADSSEKAEVTLPEEGSVKGTVLTDFAEMYMGKLSGGEKIEITDIDDQTVSIIDDEDNTGIVPRWAVSVEGDTPYSGWSAYTLEDFSAYSNYMMIGKASVFDAGTPISIIGRTETSLIIQTEGGAVFFADDDGFYKKISVTEPEPEEEVKEEDKEDESVKEKKEEDSDKKKDSDSDKKKDTDTKKDSSSDKKKEESSSKDKKETKPSDTDKKTEEKEEQSSGGGDEENYPDAVKGKVKYTAKCSVTAYCSYCDPSGVGSSGATLSEGSIAADKSIFPYGTKIYIPGYGTGTVVDTGVSGYTLDVYLGDQPDETACNAWGRKNLTVYILK